MSAAVMQNLSTLLFPVIIFASMYIFLIMPQRKREKKNREMLASLQEGQEIVTIGGVIGKILNIKDQEVIVETSIEKTQLKIMKWAVREVMPQADKKSA